jgi:hypothetical protein
VVSHRPPAPEVARFPKVTYVTDGIESAMAQARAADKDVLVQGALFRAAGPGGRSAGRAADPSDPVLFGGGLLPPAQLAAVVDGMRARGLIDTAGWLTDPGRETKERIEAHTDRLDAPVYDSLAPDELDQLIADLEPIAAALNATGSR